MLVSFLLLIFFWLFGRPLCLQLLQQALRFRLLGIGRFFAVLAAASGRVAKGCRRLFALARAIVFRFLKVERAEPPATRATLAPAQLNLAVTTLGGTGVLVLYNLIEKSKIVELIVHPLALTGILSSIIFLLLVFLLLVLF